MREILFRGKRVDNGEWVYGSFIPDLCELLYGDKLDGFIKPFGKIREERLMVEVDRKTVGQYTGLTDKNGTRIFEGDVIRDEDGDVMVVKWLTESAAFVLEPKPYASIYFYGTLSSRTEVIGNVFDNPELLEVIVNE